MVQLQEFPVPTEGIRFQDSSIVAVIDSADLGKGTLYVADDVMCWRSAEAGEGFKLQYPRMCLHAVSRDENVHPRPCIYIMVNGKFCSDEAPSEEEKDAEEDEDEEESSEIKLVPEDAELLQTIYNAVQQCSLLHPDPVSDLSAEEDSQEEDLGGAGAAGDFEDYDSDDDGYNNGHVRGMHGAGDNGDFGQIHPNQFADAD